MDGVEERLVEQITFLVKWHAVGLWVARDIDGARHERMVAAYRVPDKFEAGPGTRGLVSGQNGVRPGMSRIGAPPDARYGIVGRLGVAVDALRTLIQAGRPRQRQCALDDTWTVAGLPADGRYR